MTEYLKLKQSNCKNCYKCIRNCSVKSIGFSDNQANIIKEDCILCGHCFVACPQNAKEIRNDTERAKLLIAGDRPVYASIAPSFKANYDGITISAMKKALMQLGFAGVEETAIGATIVKKQYDKMVQEARQSVIISSCCHSVNLLIQKHYPEAIPFLAPVISPMQAHCMDIKNRLPDAATVFIGPCISKKDEAGNFATGVECVLTFEELSQWLGNAGITFENIAEQNDESRARLFPTTGGILRTMEKANPDYSYMAIDGIESCISAIKDIIGGKITHCFIEMSACIGSCIGGPVMDKKNRMPIRDYVAVDRSAGKRDFDVKEYDSRALQKHLQSLAPKRIHLGSSTVADVLKKMGKTKPEDELNCGSCGYNTCREKAEAVIRGKANLTMCLPYLKEKAESFSDNIIQNTPNAIIVLNESLEVQQINAAACKLVNVQNPQNVLNEHIVRILDPGPFYDAHQNEKNIYEQYTYLAEYQKSVYQTIIYDKEYHIIICIMRDVSEEVMRKESKDAIKSLAIEIADKVIEKQMLAVQEIALLLGETTAETKVALTNLKETLHNE